MDTLVVSRRNALKTLGLTLVPILNTPAWLRAREKGLEAFHFLVVSDTHVGKNDSPSPALQWAKTAKELERAQGDFVLHLGDVVDGGRESQYPVYIDSRKLLRKPIHEIPGNHDPLDLFERFVTRPADRSFDHKGIRFILLQNSNPLSHDGFLTPKQLGWLADQCDEAAKKDLFIIVAAHVAVHANKHPDTGWFVKPANGQTECYKLLDKHANRILALLHGHFHCGLRGWNDRDPLHEIVFPSALYNRNRNLAEQKAPGYYLTEFRPGFVEVALRASGMTLHYRPLDNQEGTRHECALPQYRR